MARIPDAFIDDLLARTDIVEVVGARVQLKRLMVDAPSLIVACGLAMRRFDPV